MTTVSLGLKLVDQFRELGLRILGRPVSAPSGTVERSGDSLLVRDHGHTVEISQDQLQLDQWDDVRYRALDRRIRLNWELYNELFAQEPLLGAVEKAQIRVRLQNMTSELCSDFREVVTIYERALGLSIPDHYQLYELCGAGA
jgi:hypothetical protein